MLQKNMCKAAPFLILGVRLEILWGISLETMLQVKLLPKAALFIILITAQLGM